MDEVTRRFGVAFRALRVLRSIVVWGVLALLALIAIALAINAFDEPPSAVAVRLLNAPENPYPPESNLYVSLVGFDAPAGQTVVSVGQRRIADYNRRVDAMLGDPLVGFDRMTLSDPHKLHFEGSMDCCHPREATFWTSVHANGPLIDLLFDKNRELFQRYLALFDLPGYYETARPSQTAPIYLMPTEVRNLFLARVAAEMQAGDDVQTQAALTSLRRDSDLWHRMLAGEGSVLSKMLAVAFLQTDSLILSDMIADPRAALPRNIDDYLPQHELSDWNIGGAFAAEFRLHAYTYRQVQALIDNNWQPPDGTASRAARFWGRMLNPIQGQLYKINATENLDARLMNQLAGLAALKPSTFASDRVRIKNWEQNSADLASIRTVYNPIGKLLVAIGVNAYANYIFLPYDAAALQRLVRLSYEIRRQRIAPSEISGFMKLHPEWSTHPADGRPFLWKPDINEIAIQPVAQQQADRRLSVQIWRESAG